MRTSSLTALGWQRLSRYAYLFYLAAPPASAAWEPWHGKVWPPCALAVRVTRAAAAADPPLAPPAGRSAWSAHVHPADCAVPELGVQPPDKVAGQQANPRRPA